MPKAVGRDMLSTAIGIDVGRYSLPEPHKPDRHWVPGYANDMLVDGRSLRNPAAPMGQCRMSTRFSSRTLPQAETHAYVTIGCSESGGERGKRQVGLPV